MTYVDPAEIDRSHLSPVRRGIVMVTRVVTFLVYLYVLFIEIILTLGFFLLLLGANPSSPFVEWVYRSLDRAMRPFRGIFEPIELGVAGNDVPSVFETSVLFAMIVYAILAILVHALLSWLSLRLERLDYADAEYRRHQVISKTVAASSRPAPITQLATTMDPSIGQPPSGS
ncbi:MAG TPA: YggT family protein [Acidimicrobiia bacterium]|nr:YggT family protein [Acidimicrobiia bacterium]